MAEQAQKSLVGHSLTVNRHYDDGSIETETIAPPVNAVPHVLMVGSADGKPAFVPVPNELFCMDEINESNVVAAVQRIVDFLKR